MTDFGSDISTFPDLDRSFTIMTGPRVVAEAIARRLETPPGGLFYDTSYGFDVRMYLNRAISSSDLTAIQHLCEAEALKDERVQQANCTVKYTPNPAPATLYVTFRMQTSSGPFQFVLSITSVTVQILNAGTS